MSEPVLVVITANNCGACQALKKTWPEIKQQIEDTKLVTIKEVNLEAMNKMVDGWPADLKRYLKWYPMFILFSPTEWSSAVSGSMNVLNGVIFNGTMVNGSPEYVKGKYTMKATGIIEWINDNHKTLTSETSKSGKTEVIPPIAPLLKASSIQPLVPKLPNPSQGKPDLNLVTTSSGTTSLKTVTGKTVVVGTDELISTCSSLLQTRRR